MAGTYLPAMVDTVCVASLLLPLLSSQRVSTFDAAVHETMRPLHCSPVPSMTPSASGSVASSQRRLFELTSTAGRGVTEVVPGVLVPTEFVAVTVTAYVTPLTRLVSVHVVAGGVLEHVRVAKPAAVAVTE